MKIVNNKSKLVQFGTVGEGEVFIANGEDVYMKTETTYCDDDGYYENAVSLDDGKLNYFKEGHMVCHVKCELVIE